MIDDVSIKPETVVETTLAEENNKKSGDEKPEKVIEGEVAKRNIVYIPDNHSV